jgi:hypothetical protein
MYDHGKACVGGCGAIHSHHDLSCIGEAASDCSAD